MRTAAVVVSLSLLSFSVVPGAALAQTGHGVCSDPNHDSMIQASGVALDYVPNFVDDDAPNVVVVAVSLGSAGEVLGTRVRKSSGNDAMDNSALKAARRTVYTPRVADCRTTSSVFLFRARFDGPLDDLSDQSPGD